VVKIKIYTTPSCPYCSAAKRFFRSLGIPFKEVDVSRNPREAELLYKKTKQMGVPVIEIGNQIVIGFNRPKIERLLGIS